MKKITLLLLFVAIGGYIQAQSLLTEDFTSNTVPPANWTIDNNATNWLSSGTNLAGGFAPECHFAYQPIFTGESHLITPAMNTTGITEINLMFRQKIYHYQGDFMVGVATRSAGGAWNTVWDTTVASATGNALESSFMISNSDVGASDFQISFFFSGNTDNTDGWYIDDVIILGVMDHDVSVNQVLQGINFAPNTVYTPKALVRNNGENTETFDVLCEILDQGNNVVYSNIQNVAGLASATTQIVTFTNYTLATANSSYTVRVTSQLTGDQDPANNTKTKVINTLGNDLLFWEDFGGISIPPMNWSIDLYPDNWITSFSEHAGGVAPELDFHWAPQFVDTSRLISPVINTTGMIGVLLNFKHTIDDYSGGYQVGVATRHGDSDWTSVWELNVSGPVAPTDISLIITNSDVGQNDFQFCFYFQGDSYNINDWYIDNVSIKTPFDHDIATEEITSTTHVAPGTNYAAQAVLKNWGVNTETFTAVCRIYDFNQNLLFTNNQTVTSLQSGNTVNVTFADYLMSVANTLYKVVVEADLATDQNPGNDEKDINVNTWTTTKSTVVVEIGTGTWCQFCPGAAMGAEEMIDSGYKVAVLEHHYDDDYENIYSLNRCALYNITGFPTAEFDGTLEYIGGSNTESMFPEYKPLYEQRILTSTPLALEVYGDNTGGTNYDLIVKCHRASPVNFSDLRLFVAVAESKIPENWQGQTVLNSVNRLMAPDTNGAPVDLNNNPDVNVNLTISLDPSWVIGHSEIIAFLQDMGTKEIFNGFRVSFDSLVSGIPTLNGNIYTVKAYPNPAADLVNIEFSLDHPSILTVEVYNELGARVNRLAQQSFKNGINTVRWNTNDSEGFAVPGGLYFIRIGGGEFSTTLPVIISR